MDGRHLVVVTLFSSGTGVIAVHGQLTGAWEVSFA